MTEHPMDAFDDRLVRLLSAYGDRAVTSFDPAAIAHTAVVAHSSRRFRLALLLGPRARLAIAVGILALLVLALALIVGSRRPAPIGDSFASPTTIAWSPDGSSLAFLVDVADALGDPADNKGGEVRHSSGRPSHPELWIVGAEGGPPRHLATFASMASVQRAIWTRDGRSILVGLDATSGGARRDAIVAVNLDGSVPRTLLDDAGGTVSMGDLSPAGDRLLYLRSDGSSTDLFVLDLASRTSARLTRSGSVCCSGSWSPDGKWIMYTDGVTGGTQGPDAATRVVAADGSVQRRLGPCCDVGWAAGGHRAFFQQDIRALYSAAEDGTDVRVVPDSDLGSVWVAAPDGSAFATSTSQGLEILHPGTAPTSLTTDQSDGDPAWSPDGTWIAFSGVRSGVAGVYVVPTTGGDPRLVSSDVRALGDPWRPGGGHAELTLIRDRAIVTADPVGGAIRDLVPRTTIAGDPIGVAPDRGSLPTIVIGPSGPDRDIYHIPVRGNLEVRFRNLSRASWAPYGGLAEKSSYCLPSSCAIEPGGTLRLTPPGFEAGRVIEIWIGPAEASDYRIGYPVFLDLEAAP